MMVVAPPATSTPAPAAAPATIDTFALPVVPAGRPVWLAAMRPPHEVHLGETEDGQLRTFDVRGRAAGIATCGAILGELAGRSALSAFHGEVCADCWATFLAVYARWM